MSRPRIPEISWAALRWLASIAIATLLLTATLTTTPATAAPSVASANRAIAASQLPHEQYRCLDRLWERESGWNHRAENPYSGAYGIPQAYPSHKMASAGSDWRTNPRTQIKWGLTYISERYGSPCNAWYFWQENNWY